MPSIEQNKTQWTHYEWSERGDEWSQVWGGTAYLWWGALYPRLMRFLPAGVILEIAPGFGRITRYLKDQCRRLVVVDLTERCIEACRARFRDERHISYHVNDGRSLAMVADASVDFAISFDSLVHADPDVLRAYLAELARKLTPAGVAFLHHSNLGAFRDAETGQLPFPNQHWRSETMSAELFREMCAESGLRCASQEIVNWGGAELHDCFSVFVRDPAPSGKPCDVRENPNFMTEAFGLGAVSRQYQGGAGEKPPQG